MSRILSIQKNDLQQKFPDGTKLFPNSTVSYVNGTTKADPKAIPWDERAIHTSQI
jgi:hypothetical protein